MINLLDKAKIVKISHETAGSEAYVKKFPSISEICKVQNKMINLRSITRGPASAVCTVTVIDDAGVEGVTYDGGAEPEVYYNLQGIRVDNPSRGLYILNGKKVMVR